MKLQNNFKEFIAASSFIVEICENARFPENLEKRGVSATDHISAGCHELEASLQPSHLAVVEEHAARMSAVLACLEVTKAMCVLNALLL